MALSVRGHTSQSSTASASYFLDLDADISGLAADDLLIAQFVSAIASLTPTVPATNGTWTELRAGSSQMNDTLRWRITDGTEASEEWTTTSTSRSSIGVMAITGVDTADPFRVTYATASDTTGSATSFVAPTLTGGLAGDLLVCTWVLDHLDTAAGTWTAPAGMTATVNQSVTGTARMLMAYEFLPEGFSGPTGTRTAANTIGANRYVATSMLVKDPASVPPPTPVGGDYGFMQGAHF